MQIHEISPSRNIHHHTIVFQAVKMLTTKELCYNSLCYMTNPFIETNRENIQDEMREGSEDEI
ncbi:hypothetical protein ACOI1C_03145 [Bacillus sp. DJP31]|uniref:hypothetical protein n=1 Tax=Bacillus sp. DJP31 TaxID=3409789 RepID=UPI003BB6EA81